MSEQINASAFGAAGLGLPTCMWALDQLKVEFSKPVVVLILIISAACVVVSLALWAHLLMARFGVEISWLPWSRRIPLHIAATRIYEAAEKADVLDLMFSPDAAPEVKLNHFKMLIVVDDGPKIFGVKAPSTESKLIPKNVRSGKLYPVDGKVSELTDLFSPGPTIYTNVTIGRGDLRRLTRKYLTEYVSEARALAKR